MIHVDGSVIVDVNAATQHSIDEFFERSKSKKAPIEVIQRAEGMVTVSESREGMEGVSGGGEGMDRVSGGGEGMEEVSPGRTGQDGEARGDRQSYRAN